jgi:hypothetical protein
MTHHWTPWCELLESERSIYMEFYAPVDNNLKVMPCNNDLLVDEYISPSDDQINYVVDTLDVERNTINNRFTDGQMNAVIFWIEEHYEFMREYMGPVIEYIPTDASDDSSSDEDSSDDSSSDEDDIEITDDEDDDEGEN